MWGCFSELALLRWDGKVASWPLLRRDGELASWLAHGREERLWGGGCGQEIVDLRWQCRGRPGCVPDLTRLISLG
jgi:hypothetical protein